MGCTNVLKVLFRIRGGGRQLVGMSPFTPPNPHQNFTYEYTIVYIFCKALPEMLR